jgi:very-short-patch-repair endonuclease
MQRQSREHTELVRNLRKSLTPSEKVLWEAIRKRQLGVKFRRQRPIDAFVADFCCDELKLVIEVDGASHDSADQREYDHERDRYMVEQDYTVLRIRAADVMSNVEDVTDEIRREIARLRTSPIPLPPSPARGEGEKDRA